MDDFVPISLLASEPDLILTRKTMSASSLKELIDWLKAHAETATGGTSGVGGPSHVAAVLFQEETGTHFQLVPYRGAGPAIQDLLGERLDVMITGPSVALPYLQAGKINAYAVTTGHRIAAAPEVPTTDEAGLPGFHVDVWQGLWAPKATPKEIIMRLSAAAHDALADAGVRQRFARPRHPARAAARPGRAARLPEGGDRQVVASHQSGEHQRRVTMRLLRQLLGRRPSSPKRAGPELCRQPTPGSEARRCP